MILARRRSVSLARRRSGVRLLNPSLVINGTAVTPAFRVRGGDANGTNWPYWGYGGTAPTLQAGTAPSYNQGSVFTGIDDDSVDFNGGGYYKGGDTTTGDVATEDFAFEAVVKVGAASKYFAAKLLNVTTYQGWVVGVPAGGTSIVLTVQKADGAGCTASSPAVTAGQLIHIFAACNRDETVSNGMVVCVDGVAGATAATLSETLSSARELHLGTFSYDPATYVYGTNVYYVALWKQANWLAAGAGGMTEIASIAASRFAALTGRVPGSWT